MIDGSVPSAPRVPLARTKSELRAARAGLTGRVALVATMGALHEGHAALIREGRRLANAVIVSIFVNPLQFGPAEDFARYPRPLEADLDVCAAEGVDLVFAPSVAELYPVEPRVRVSAGDLGGRLEGSSRPGHFDGVVHVVAKLLNLTQPAVALFGEKDYQQLELIRRMVADLDFPVDIAAVPIVREADGLARSSRNRYLDAEQRQVASVLPDVLAAGADAAPGGVPAVLEAAHAKLRASSGFRLDYLRLVGPDFEDVPAAYRGPARLLAAAYVGNTRLLDNVPVLVGWIDPAAERPDPPDVVPAPPAPPAPPGPPGPAHA